LFSSFLALHVLKTADALPSTRLPVEIRLEGPEMFESARESETERESWQMMHKGKTRNCDV